MQVKEKNAIIIEPFTYADLKFYLGYQNTDQDVLFTDLITAAREWLEDHCAFSCILKSYIARFEKSDMVNEWYELPFVPVTEITSVIIAGEIQEYEEKGDEKRYIKPNSLFYTGTTAYEVIVEFKAGKVSKRAELGIKRICSDMFNLKNDNPININIAKISYDTLRYCEALNQNTGL